MAEEEETPIQYALRRHEEAKAEFDQSIADGLSEVQALRLEMRVGFAEIRLALAQLCQDLDGVKLDLLDRSHPDKP